MEFLKAFIFGLVLAAGIGPMGILMFQRTISKGIKSGVLTATGVALADWTLAIVAFSVGASILLFVDKYESLVYIFSGTVLLGLALYILRSSYISYQEGQMPKAAPAKGSDFISAYILTVHNPLTIGVFLGFMGQITDIQSITSIILYASILFLGSLAGQLIIVFISHNMRSFFKGARNILIMNIFSSIVVCAFAALSFAKLFGS